MDKTYDNTLHELKLQYVQNYHELYVQALTLQL